MNSYSRSMVLCSLLTSFSWGCGTRPVQALTAAEKAIAAASLAEKCAPDEYAAAQRLFEKAQMLADKGEFAKAEATANAAKQLALKAAAKAEERKEECLKPKEDKTLKPEDFIDASGPGLDAVDGDSGGMKSIYFPFNAPTLTDVAQNTLNGNVRWLQRNAAVQIMVEGHCDERGSTEYNLALGEKRAQMTRKYLVGKGVDRNRIGLVSYGEERPTDFGQNEQAYQRNRRAEFRKASSP
jgi:peptidoglycan-associated lipoprotein